MIKIYKKFRDFIFDLIFPRMCVGCGVEGKWICAECLKKIDIIKQPFCPECRRPTEIGEFCDVCRGGLHPPALDGIFICANFDEGVLKEAIHKFKYEFLFDIGGILGRLVSSKLVSSKQKDENGKIPEFDLIIPVPLHKKRKAWRGFNQAEILSYELLRILTNRHEWENIILAKNILIRKKYNTPQMELGREERLKNLKDIFEINVGVIHELPLQGKNILLVDDITTTGATLEECAKVLKNAGAKSVWGIVLAKGK